MCYELTVVSPSGADECTEVEVMFMSKSVYKDGDVCSIVYVVLMNIVMGVNMLIRVDQ